MPHDLPVQATECCPTTYPEGRVDMSIEFGEMSYAFHWSCRVAILVTELGICRAMVCTPVPN